MCDYNFWDLLKLTRNWFTGICISDLFQMTVIMSSIMITKHYSGIEMWKKMWLEIKSNHIKLIKSWKIILASDNAMLNTLLKRTLFAVAFISGMTNDLCQTIIQISLKFVCLFVFWRNHTIWS